MTEAEARVDLGLRDVRYLSVMPAAKLLGESIFPPHMLCVFFSWLRHLNLPTCFAMYSILGQRFGDVVKLAYAR